MTQIQLWKPVPTKASDLEYLLESRNVYLDGLIGLWNKRRAQLAPESTSLKIFLENRYRKHAVETGIVEGIYTLSRGLTHSLVVNGFDATRIEERETNIPPQKLSTILNDQKNAVEFIVDIIAQQRPLSTFIIKQLDEMVCASQGTYKSYDQDGNTISTPLVGGQYKTQPNFPVRAERQYLYCEPALVGSEVDNLITGYNTLKELGVRGYVIAAWLHYQFILIHPFPDGNGKVARLLASIVLMENKLLPMTVEGEKRQDYFSALESADEGNFEAFVQYVARLQIEELEQGIQIDTIEQKQQFGLSIDELSSIINEKTKTLPEQIHELFERSYLEVKEHIEITISNLATKISSSLQNTTVKFKKEEHLNIQDNLLNKQFNQMGTHINIMKPTMWWSININLPKSLKEFTIYLCFHKSGSIDSQTSISSFLTIHETTVPDAASIMNLKSYIVNLDLAQDNDLIADISSHLTEVVQLALVQIIKRLN